MRIKAFTHTDGDGHSVNVIDKVFNLGSNLENINTGKIDETILNYIDEKLYVAYDITFIIDLPISPEVAQAININCADKIIMLDHHEESCKISYKWAHNAVDIDGVKQCGGTLFYKYLIEKLGYRKNLILEKYLEGIRLYDTGDWLSASNKINKNFFPEELNMLFSLYRKTFPDVLVNNIRNGKVLSYENKMVAFQMIEKNRSYAKRKNEELTIVSVGEYKAGVVFVGQVSEIDRVHIYLKKNNPNLDFFIMIIMKASISLRTTNPNIDLNEIAKKFGGGGHKSASGIPYDDKIVTNILINSKLY